MAKKRPSVQKRQREYQKRQREFEKAEKAAEKRKRREAENEAGGATPPAPDPGEDEEPGTRSLE